MTPFSFRAAWSTPGWSTLFAALLAASAHAQPLPETSALIFEANAPVIQTTRVSTPVSSARTWTTALAPNARGGWNFITQSYENKSGKPTEYVVLDLGSGKYSVMEGQGGYSNSNYGIANQARAANGRIFFSESGNTISYYDPADEKIHSLGKLALPGEHTFVFSWRFAADGKLYGTTQSKGKDAPVVVQIDPENLKWKVVGQVGKDRTSYSYGYTMIPDVTPSEAVPQGWVYVAVGQATWQIAALNIATGEQTILADLPAGSWADVDDKGEGVIIKLTTNKGRPDAKGETFWAVDGKLLPYELGYDPAKLPFTPRDVKPLKGGKIENPPELDLGQLNPDSEGVGRVFWRPSGSKNEADWKEATFKVQHTAPIEIESLIALPDGTLLGNAVQYHGFFRFDPKSGQTKFFGMHGPSRGPRAVVDGKVYIAGYPNSVLYVYDPDKPWTSNRRAETLLEKSLQDQNAQGAPGVLQAALNPTNAGVFRTFTDTHYGYLLAPSKNGRLYFGGRRERTGVGGGVGWYDTKTKTFGGHHENLATLPPRGMVVLDDLERVVYSGLVGADPAKPGEKIAGAQLIVYDMDLKELERISIRPGMKSTGLLLGSAGSQIIGISQEDALMYAFDLKDKRVLKMWELPKGGIGDNSFVQDKNNLWWGVIGGHLVTVDVAEMEIKTVGKFERAPSRLAWSGDELYGAVGEELHKITLPHR